MKFQSKPLSMTRNVQLQAKSFSRAYNAADLQLCLLVVALFKQLDFCDDEEFLNNDNHHDSHLSSGVSTAGAKDHHNGRSGTVSATRLPDRRHNPSISHRPSHLGVISNNNKHVYSINARKSILDYNLQYLHVSTEDSILLKHTNTKSVTPAMRQTVQLLLTECQFFLDYTWFLNIMNATGRVFQDEKYVDIVTRLFAAKSSNDRRAIVRSIIRELKQQLSIDSASMLPNVQENSSLFGSFTARLFSATIASRSDSTHYNHNQNIAALSASSSSASLTTSLSESSTYIAADGGSAPVDNSACNNISNKAKTNKIADSGIFGRGRKTIQIASPRVVVETDHATALSITSTSVPCALTASSNDVDIQNQKADISAASNVNESDCNATASYTTASHTTAIVISNAKHNSTSELKLKNASDMIFPSHSIEIKKIDSFNPLSQVEVASTKNIDQHNRIDNNNSVSFSHPSDQLLFNALLADENNIEIAMILTSIIRARKRQLASHHDCQEKNISNAMALHSIFTESEDVTNVHADQLAECDAMWDFNNAAHTLHELILEDEVHESHNSHTKIQDNHDIAEGFQTDMMLSVRRHHKCDSLDSTDSLLSMDSFSEPNAPLPAEDPPCIPSIPE
jgi:hypothetical protein